MNLAESLVVLVASFALLFFGSRANAHAILRKFPWVVGQLFAMTILWLFAGGLMGIAVSLNWVR